MNTTASCTTFSSVGAALAEDGFAVVPGVFSIGEIRQVEALLDEVMAHAGAAGRRGHRFAGDMQAMAGALERAGQTAPDQLEVRYAATFEPRLLDTAVFVRCQALAQALCGRVSLCFDHAIVKRAHNRAATPWHQDAAFARWPLRANAVRPSRLHFWIPLQEASAHNGCMEFIRGSHRERLLHHDPFLQAPGSRGLEARAADVDHSRRTACVFPVGGLLLHTPYTLHYAGQNASSAPRKAWILQFSRFGDARLRLKRLTGQLPRALPGTRTDGVGEGGVALQRALPHRPDAPAQGDRAP